MSDAQTSPDRLAKTLGVLAITASSIAAYLFAVFSSVMPRAGSKHVWIAHRLGMLAGFSIRFGNRAAGPASMGVLAYAFRTLLPRQRYRRARSRCVAADHDRAPSWRWNSQVDASGMHDPQRWLPDVAPLPSGLSSGRTPP